MEAVAARKPCTPLVEPGRIDHQVTDLTVTFAADVTLAQLQAHLAPANQWLPADGDENLPLGDLILRNSTGPLRLGYGAWRDVLLGAQFVNGRGELITVGGRVLKNVAGYDVTKLLVGSHGVFGKPICFTARTWKRPAATFLVAVPSAQAVARFAGLLTTPLRPQWAVLTKTELLLGYHGDRDAVEFYKTSSTALKPTMAEAHELGDGVRIRAQAWPADSRFRASVPPDRIVDFAKRAGLFEYSADPAFGVVVAPPESPIDPGAIRTAARGLGGSSWFYYPDGRLAEISIDPAAYDVLKRVKSAFDPDHTLPPLPANIR